MGGSCADGIRDAHSARDGNGPFLRLVQLERRAVVELRIDHRLRLKQVGPRAHEAIAKRRIEDFDERIELTPRRHEVGETLIKDKGIYL